MSRAPAALTAGALVLLLALGACGKRGAPVPPDGATYPRQYPAPRYVLPESAAPEPAIRQQRQPEQLQFFPNDRTRTTVYESVPPVAPAVPEAPETREATPETTPETGE